MVYACVYVHVWTLYVPVYMCIGMRIGICVCTREFICVYICVNICVYLCCVYVVYGFQQLPPFS